MRMLPAAIIASLALSSAALAAPTDKITAAPEAVELSGAVELALFGNTMGNGPLDFVLGYTSEDEDANAVGIHLSTTSEISAVTRGVAEKLELKVKKLKLNGQQVEYVLMPQLWLGAERQIVIKNLPMVIVETNPADVADLDDLDDAIGVNLAQLGVAWAVRPSNGTVHFAPADQASALLSAVGGTQLSFTRMAAEKVQYGKDKGWTTPLPYLIDGNVGGQDLKLALSLGGMNAVSNQVELPEAPLVEVGDRDIQWQSIALGGVDLGSDWVLVESGFRVLDVENPVRMGMIGATSLTDVDIAVDPAGTIALAVAADQKRKDPRERSLAAAKSDLDKCLAPPEGDEAPTEDADAPPPAEKCAAQYASVAKVQLRNGDTAGALATWKTITDDPTNARDCTNWMSFGGLQASTGDIDGAIASLTKASEQYHGWWDMEAYERLDAQKAFDKLKEEEQDAATVRPQPDACHVADGQLAAAWFAKGDSDKVAEIYTAHLDLDPSLASVYGAELVLADKLEAAHGPLRMVDHLTLGGVSNAKSALGHVFAMQNDWEGASANYMRALETDPTALTTTGMWVRDMARAVGPDDALEAARKWATQRPDVLSAYYGVAVAAKLAGKDPQFIVRDGDPVFQDALRMAPNDAFVNAAWARFLVETGRAGQGIKIAEKAVQLDPTSPQAWLSLAIAQEAVGKDDAKASYGRAVAAGALTPAFALQRPKAQ
ncbi:MAG: hypothetical protein H6742_17415 [Alphaproteobacteria bacterium]|nr:hypothetical protein [Alphaproteobacteria bacterium]